MSLRGVLLKNKVPLAFACLSSLLWVVAGLLYLSSRHAPRTMDIYTQVVAMLLSTALFFFYGWMIGVLVVSRGRAEYAWAVVLLVAGHFVFFGGSAVGLYASYPFLLLGMIPVVFLSVGYSLQFLGLGSGSSQLLGPLLSLVGMGGLAGWAYLYLSKGQGDSVTRRVAVRRLLLAVFVLVFLLGLHGCSISPQWTGG